MDYRKAVNDLVAALQAQPFLTIYDLYMGEGLSQQEITEIESRYGVTLPEDVRAFYSQLNGLCLRWGVPDDANGYAIAHVRGRNEEYELPALPDDSQYPTASIAILELDQLFTSYEGTWREDTLNPLHEPILDFRGKQVANAELLADLRIFDDCGGYYGGAFCNAMTDVILLSNHYINWNDSQLTTFRDYLNHVLAYAGLLAARNDWLSPNWTVPLPKPDGPDFLLNFQFISRPIIEKTDTSVDIYFYSRRQPINADKTILQLMNHPIFSDGEYFISLANDSVNFPEGVERNDFSLLSCFVVTTDKGDILMTDMIREVRAAFGEETLLVLWQNEKVWTWS